MSKGLPLSWWAQWSSTPAWCVWHQWTCYSAAPSAQCSSSASRSLPGDTGIENKDLNLHVHVLQNLIE